MPTESVTVKFDETPDPSRLASVKAEIAGFEDATAIVFRLDDGHREVEIDGKLRSIKTDMHAEGRRDNEYLRGYPILAKQNFHETISLADLLSKLEDPKTFGKRGARCFMLGLGISLRSGYRTIDLLFCLGCQYLFVFQACDPVVIPLSFQGVSYFRGNYVKLFPDLGDCCEFWNNFLFNLAITSSTKGLCPLCQLNGFDANQQIANQKH